MDGNLLQGPVTIYPAFQEQNVKKLAQLAQKIILKNGAVKFYAYKTYCYKSIIDSLETLLKRSGLEEQCEKWKSRKIDNDLYADVYDGQIWKQFDNWKGNKPFLDLPTR